ncbi:MAG TPA: MraY family glycosyltransferase [Blastocatellia bacterium]|nr:MraY family glycosyltransferase [Blastocatellia bacterium]
MALIYLTIFIASVLLSFALTWNVRNIALARGWVALPESRRHIHEVPLPRLGGVAIFFSFVTVIALLVIVSALFHFESGLSPQKVFYLILCGTIVFGLGLYDDLRPIGPYVKLAVQSLAAVMLFIGGFRVLRLPLLFGGEDFGWVALPLTIIWVLLITNAFNLIDGLDGLAAGSALFSTLTVFIISLVSGDPLISLLTVVLAGAILGFLRFNFNPATIFLGDSGSLFIGFMLSALALAGSQKAPTAVAVAIPVVSFGLPLVETTLSVFRRWLNGQPLFSADREHIHHKLLERGFSQRQVVVMLYGVSALCGMLSLFLLNPGGATVGIVLFVLGVGIWVGVQHLGYHEFFELGRVAHRTIEQKKIIVNNLAIRRAARDLARAESFDDLRRVLDQAFRSGDFDGYELRIDPAFIEVTLVKSNQSVLEQHGEQLLLSWRKPEREQREESSWSIALELKSNSQRLGSFSVFREYCDRSLLVDINLLITGFHDALTEAVDRLLGKAMLELQELKTASNKSLSAGAMLESRDQSADNVVADGV